MWTIDAARYEDLESGEVEVYASVDRLECVGDDTGLSCRGGPMWESGTPQTFEFADDLTRAAVRVVAFRQRESNV